MFSNTKIALAAALVLGAGSAALAANENDSTGGYRELGPGGVVTDGVNPVFHPSMRTHGGANAYDYIGSPSQQQGQSRRKGSDR
jgi:hypothetical protein